MPRILKIILPLLVFVLIFSNNIAWATGIYDLPSLQSISQNYLVDQAEVISLSNENKINKQLAKVAETTGDQIRIVTVKRLDYGATINGLANELFSKWYPNKQEQENQVLLVLDTLSNNVAMVVGEKVTNRLSPEIVSSITDKTVAIPLRDGSKYNEAILDASNRTAQVVSGQEDPGPPQERVIDTEGTFTTAENTNDRSATVWVIVLLVVATAIPMATYFWYVGRN
jgi:uncharacterized protein